MVRWSLSYGHSVKARAIPRLMALWATKFLGPKGGPKWVNCDLGQIL